MSMILTVTVGLIHTCLTLAPCTFMLYMACIYIYICVCVCDKGHSCLLSATIGFWADDMCMDETAYEGSFEYVALSGVIN